MKLLSLLLCVPAFGVEVRLTDRILPLIQDGGGASSTITIVNLETATSSFEILFLTDGGAYWNMPFAAMPAGVTVDGAYVRGTLAPGRGVTLQTPGAKGDMGTGHATIYSPENARLGVNVRVDPAGWTFTASPQREDTSMFPFDNTSGAFTSFLWVSDSPSTLVSYRATAEDGTLLAKGQYQFSASDSKVQTLFSVADLIPSTAGLRGVISLQIDYPNAGIYDERYFTGLSIQTDANGNAVVKPSMSTGTWKASPY